MSNLEILRRHVNDSDPLAFSELVARHIDWVYAAALRQVRDPHTADEMTVEQLRSAAGVAGEQRLLHLLRLRPHFIDVADVQERLLRQIVCLAVADLLEAAERVGELDVLPFLAGELLGDIERLAEEALDLSGATGGPC